MRAIGAGKLLKRPKPAIVTKFDYDWVAGTYKGAGASGGVAFNEQAGSTQELIPDSTGALTSYAAFFFSLSTGSARRGAGLGNIVALAATNFALWSRDLTNAVWTKTNCTAAKDQVGRLAGANGASSVTVTADGGTCLQSITLASGARRFYADVKRITGTGTVEMTMDGGTTWVAISPTSITTRYGIPAQTVTNPTVGFRFGTNGDKFLIDFAQLDSTTYEGPPIITTSATATVDNNRYAAYGNQNIGLLETIRSPGWAMFIEWIQRRDSGALIVAATGYLIDTNNAFNGADNGKLAFFPHGDGLNGATTGVLKTANLVQYSPNAALGQGTVNRCCVGIMPGGVAFACLNGGAVVRGTGFSAFDPTADHMDIGTNGNAGANIAGTLRRFVLYRDQGNPTDAQLQNWTANGFTGQ